MLIRLSYLKHNALIIISKLLQNLINTYIDISITIIINSYTKIVMKADTYLHLCII